MLFEALFKNSGLVFGEPELLPRRFVVFFIADSSRTSSVRVLLLATVCLPLASLPADARNRAVRRRNSRLLVAIDLRRQSIHVDPLQKRPRLASKRFRTSICIDFNHHRVRMRLSKREVNYSTEVRLFVCFSRENNRTRKRKSTRSGKE